MRSKIKYNKNRYATNFTCLECCHGKIILWTNDKKYVIKETCSHCEHIYIFEKEEQITINQYLKDLLEQKKNNDCKTPNAKEGGCVR